MRSWAVPALLLFGLLFFLGCFGIGESPPPAPEYNPNPLPPSPGPFQPGPPPAPAPAPVGLQIHFVDVGYGDATLIRSDGQVVLIDTGTAESASKLVAYLHAQGVEKIDLLILSTPDLRFSGGASSVLRSFTVGQVWTNGVNYTDSNWRVLSDLLRSVPSKSVEYGDAQTWGKLTLTALNPQSPRSLSNPDLDSVALKLSYGHFCALLFSNSEAAGASGADAGTVVGGVESKIITGPLPVVCPVLRVSHHGSGNSASFQLLDSTKPEAAIISVGPNPPQNAYPEPTTIRRLALKNVSIYITDRLGTVTVASDGLGYEVRPEKPWDDSYGRLLNNVAFGGKKYWG